MQPLKIGMQKVVWALKAAMPFVPVPFAQQNNLKMKQLLLKTIFGKKVNPI